MPIRIRTNIMIKLHMFKIKKEIKLKRNLIKETSLTNINNNIIFFQNQRYKMRPNTTTTKKEKIYEHEES